MGYAGDKDARRAYRINDDRLEGMLHLLEHSIALENIDYANEEKETITGMTASRQTTKSRKYMVFRSWTLDLISGRRTAHQMQR